MRWTSVQSFYEERVATARTHAGMKPTGLDGQSDEALSGGDGAFGMRPGQNYSSESQQSC